MRLVSANRLRPLDGPAPQAHAVESSVWVRLSVIGSSLCLCVSVVILSGLSEVLR